MCNNLTIIKLSFIHSKKWETQRCSIYMEMYFHWKRNYRIKIDMCINKTRKYHWNKCPITIASIISPFLAVFFSSVLGGRKTRPLAARKLASLELIWNCFWNILKSTTGETLGEEKYRWDFCTLTNKQPVCLFGSLK